MAEGVRVRATVDFDQPGKKGEPHAQRHARATFHACIDGVTPKPTTPTDRNRGCTQMFRDDYFVALVPVVIVSLCISSKGLRCGDNYLRVAFSETKRIGETGLSLSPGPSIRRFQLGVQALSRAAIIAGM